MLQALEVLLPVFVTMLLGYGAVAHHRFDAKQVPVLNKMVLLYAVPTSISVGLLQTPRATLLADLGLVLVLALVIVLLGVEVPQLLDNSLSLLGQAPGGVGLFTTGIILQSYCLSARPAAITSMIGKNIVTRWRRWARSTSWVRDPRPRTRSP